MVEPTNCIDHGRTNAELEEFFLFCIMVANKNSDQTKEALEFILGDEPYLSPFEVITVMVASGTLMEVLRESRCGQYNARRRSMEYIAEGKVPDLRTATPQELEQVPGVGPKTSRFFIMATRPDAEHAALDTHTEIDPTQTLVNMGGTMPDALKDAKFACEGVNHKGGYEFHRQFFLTAEGLDLEYLVYEWTWHPHMPDCRIGWVSGPYSIGELMKMHPEYEPLRQAEIETREEIEQVGQG
jgi:hypothetical protein